MLGDLSHYEKLSIPLLEDKETGRQFSLLILKLLLERSNQDGFPQNLYVG